MLREIGWPTYLLVIITAVVVLIVLSQTTTLGPLAGGVGVTSDTALIWGQSAEPMSEMTEEPAAAMDEATEEPAEAATQAGG